METPYRAPETTTTEPKETPFKRMLLLVFLALPLTILIVLTVVHHACGLSFIPYVALAILFGSGARDVDYNWRGTLIIGAWWPVSIPYFMFAFLWRQLRRLFSWVKYGQ